MQTVMLVMIFLTGTAGFIVGFFTGYNYRDRHRPRHRQPR